MKDADVRRLIKQPHEQRKLYAHPDHRGLYLVVSPTAKEPAVAWWYRYTKNGKQIVHVLGHWNDKGKEKGEKDKGMNTKKAVEACQKAQVERREGTLVKDDDDDDKLRTVNDVLDAYEHDGMRERKRWQEVISNFTHRVRLMIGDTPLEELTLKVCRERVLDPIEREGKPAARNAVLMHTKAAFNWSVKQGLISSNPWNGIDKLKILPRERTLSPGELRKLVAWIRQDTTIWSDAIELLLLTGCRRKEVVQAPLAEFDDDLWVIPAERMKGKREHRVFLSKRALAIVKFSPENLKKVEVPNGTPSKKVEGPVGPSSKKHGLAKTNPSFVFPSDRTQGPVNDVEVARYLRTAISAQGWQHFTLHDLRRTMATWLGENEDCPGEVIERMLAHAPHGVTRMHYNKAKLNKPAARWWQNWSDYLRSLEPVRLRSVS